MKFYEKKAFEGKTKRKGNFIFFLKIYFYALQKPYPRLKSKLFNKRDLF